MSGSVQTWRLRRIPALGHPFRERCNDPFSPVSDRRAARAVAALCPTVARAQTTLNSTTTSASVDNKQQVIPLTAVTNISASSRNLAGDVLYFADNSGEAVQVNAIDTTAKTVTVTRGVRSTPATAHLSGTTVWTGPGQRFAVSLGFGTCTAANEAYLPRIVLNRNVVQDCLGAASGCRPT
jgi:hypothetical protein